MANQVAKEAIYLTKDGQPVKAGDPAAASLLVAQGLELTDEQVKQYGVAKFMTDAQPAYDAVADHEARHAVAPAQPEPVEETDDAKAAAPKANKAKAPASNKSE